MRQISVALNESVRSVKDTCSDAEFEAYRTVVAPIMADIYLHVMQPLHRFHPDLESEELKQRS